ncbi:Protein of uncharacterised function (DUF2766) [Raoultella ornithinolytica]|nr:Protein of uncharacterised function (DUF2766) [Raoultella ornithinolytica]
MSQHLTEQDELVSDVVACQLVIKQILDVIDVIAPVEVREKMTTQLKAIDFCQPSGFGRSGDAARGPKSDCAD